MRSGSDVVAAAMMPPVGRYVSALSVTSDRVTASLQGLFAPLPCPSRSGQSAPPLLSLAKPRFHVDLALCSAMREMPAERKRQSFARADAEFRDGAVVPALQRSRRVQL